MKRYISLFVVLAIAFSSRAQSHGFQAYPLKGKIKTNEIFKIENDYPTNINTTEYNTKGEVVYSRKLSKDAQPVMEKTIVNGDEVITYKCYCESIDPLEKKFKPIGFRKEKNTGSVIGSSTEPRVEISKTDKNGNPIETYYYFQSGYIQSYSKMKYDEENRIVRTESYDAQENLYYYENNTYDNRGNLISRNSKYSVDASEMTSNYTYDDNNNVVETSMLKGDKIISHYKYFSKRNNNIEFHYTWNVLKGDTTITRETVYDEMGKETKRSLLQHDGKVFEIMDSEYYKSGRLAKETFYTIDGSKIREAKFTDDKLGNCEEIIQYISTTSKSADGTKKTEKVPHVFRQKITYF